MVSFYYHLKPYLPWRLRLALRRVYARGIVKGCGDVWPIKESAGRSPKGWPGWPDRKKFALVLTHDVEGQRGLAKVRQLAELEMEMGFRSSFNFVPEGTYAVPKELREWLTRNGFEVAVHDLHHDGKLYRSRKAFQRSAERINHYLKDWGAVGFRSAFMLRRLEWLDDLRIKYDASTFDTDPFEPQPDGVDTIFPFWVPAAHSQMPTNKSGLGNPSKMGGPKLGDAIGLSRPASIWTDRGYCELPYTLVQDFSLFVVLRQPTIETWTRKLAWIAECGGMVMLITHPDYMSFGRIPSKIGQFPVAHYVEFLQHIQRLYTGAYWHALPKEVAAYVQPTQAAPFVTSAQQRPETDLTSSNRVNGNQKRIWIDLDNTPHVPFFKPIVRELEERHHPVILTARDAFQVCELAGAARLSYTKVGRHYGRNPLRKLVGIVLRASQLAPFVWKHKPALGLSHGSRSQILLCNLLHIPTILIIDYEHAKHFPFSRPTWEIVPDAITAGQFLCPGGRIRKYTGIKEDVYAPEFKPDAAILQELGLSPEDLVVTVRPPATEAHYHNPESEVLFVSFMDRLTQKSAAKAVLLPRNKRQEEAIRSHWPHWFSSARVIIPRQAVNGLNLLWHSDLVVSGGGTMNREAAALGIPVYSIFRGPIGAVDQQLSAAGRLTLIQNVQEVHTRIPIQRRERKARTKPQDNQTLRCIISHIEEILDTGRV
jgi:predicted glycosyltransferase